MSQIIKREELIGYEFSTTLASVSNVNYGENKNLSIVVTVGEIAPTAVYMVKSQGKCVYEGRIFILALNIYNKA